MTPESRRYDAVPFASSRGPTRGLAARRPLRGWPVVLALLGAVGCAKPLYRPPCDRPDLGGCAIEELDLEGNAQVSSGDIEERIATAKTSHLLEGVVEHVPVFSVFDALTVDYEHFDRFVLERDLARIERYYRARGFYSAKVRAARVVRIGDARGDAARVEIAVVEGEPVTITAVELAWKDWDLQKGQRVLRSVSNAKNKLKIGARFEEEAFEQTKKELVRAMSDRGFAYASVDGHADVDIVTREARVTFTLELGPESRYGPIRIEGLGELPERPLRAALNIHEGERFSTEAIEQAERALVDFGVFGAIDVKVQLSPEGKPKDPVVPVTFLVQPAALRSVQLGGGAELGGRAEVHLVAGWEDRNFLGGLRRFSIEARPGLIFYPTTFGTLFDAAPTRILPQVQLRSELRQPAAIEARTTAVLRGAFKHYRLLTSETGAAEVDPDQPIVGYREIAGAVGLERPFLKSDLNIALYYNVQHNDPFSYNDVKLDPRYQSLVIAYFQNVISYDLRRNARGKPERINPHKGVYVATDAQVAGYPLGDAVDFRIQPELRAYIPVSRKATLAVRLLGGLLFPQNYGEAFSAGDTEDPEFTRDLQLLQFRAFFSGGSASNRGYGYNEIGPHDVVTSLIGSPSDRPVPTGGLSLWETSLELRIPVVGAFGAAIFADASDVTREVTSFRLTRPHLSVGLGLRYGTPVGPLRVDIGYRIPCAQVVGFCPDEPLPADEGVPGTTLGLPIAVNIAIGEAF